MTRVNLRKRIEFYVDENGCHVCTSHWKDKDGYPQYFLKKRMPIGRYIYMKIFGNIPEGKVVRHSCDNRACINPEHLLLGTQKDNVDDAVKRGRHIRGECAGSAKLNNKQVVQIKRMYNNTKTSFEKLGRLFNVNPSTIRKIICNDCWKHIEA